MMKLRLGFTVVARKFDDNDDELPILPTEGAKLFHMLMTEIEGLPEMDIDLQIEVFDIDLKPTYE
jgi:hypothetical protein